MNTQGVLASYEEAFRWLARHGDSVRDELTTRGLKILLGTCTHLAMKNADRHDRTIMMILTRGTAVSQT